MGIFTDRLRATQSTPGATQSTPGEPWWMRLAESAVTRLESEVAGLTPSVTAAGGAPGKKQPAKESALAKLAKPSGEPMEGVESSVSVPVDILSKRETAVADILATPGPEEEEYQKLYQQMTSVASTLMRGELPEDVRELVQTRAAEAGLTAGLGAGSPAARGIVARDLGLTSLSLVEAGMTAGQALAGMAEARRQYNTNTKLAAQEYLENVRRGDLSATELVERSRQYNVQVQSGLTEFLTNTLLSYHQLALSYATAPASDALAAQGKAYQKDISAAIKNLLTTFA